MNVYEAELSDFTSSAQLSQNTSQNSFSTFFENKIQIFRFPCCSTNEDLSIDVSITNVGLILTKIGRYLISEYGQTDGQTDGWTERKDV